jgi:hypothetical protein
MLNGLDGTLKIGVKEWVYKMKFKQYENGSCDIEFSWKERITLFKKGKLHLSDENLKHFGNNLVKMVMDWQIKFKEDVANKQSFTDTKIEGK